MMVVASLVVTGHSWSTVTAFNIINMICMLSVINIMIIMITLSSFLIIIFNYCQVLLSTVAAFLIIVSSLLLWTKVIRDRME